MDVVANILSKLLTSHELKNTGDNIKNFLNCIINAQMSKTDSEKPISSFGFSIALMRLLKINEISQYFINNGHIQMYY